MPGIGWHLGVNKGLKAPDNAIGNAVVLDRISTIVLGMSLPQTGSRSLGRNCPYLQSCL
ncbi:hypothetical protein SynROS8604_01027 [Synechococcus sp. ROS8604]|nr:hypothetical protein SynROS8604_01027 [Synechococcus sp. ROS8604]